MKRVFVLVVNGTVSAVTAFLMSGIGVWFSLYLSSRLGTAEMGQYQLILSVYGFGVTLAASGANFAAMRVISEALGRGEEIRPLLKKCFRYCACFGFGSAILLFVLAPFLSARFLPHADAALALRIMSVSLPCIAAEGVINGYFAAIRKVYRTAVVRIGTQLFKIGLTAAFLPVCAAHLCLAPILAGTIGELGEVTVLFLLYQSEPRGGGTQPHGKILRIALPIALSSYLRSGLVTVQHLLVPSRLQKSGMTQGEAVSVFGAIHGILLPIVLFPTSLLFSFSDLIVPEVAELRAVGGIGSKRMTYLIERSLHLTLIFAVGTAGALFFFAGEWMTLIGNHADLSGFLKAFSLAVPIMYLDHTADNLLKGLDQQRCSMRYNVIDAAASLGLVFWLLPRFGAVGYVVTICLGELLNFSLSFSRLCRVIRFFPLHGAASPLLSAALAGGFARTFLCGIPSAAVRLAIGMPLGIGGYFVLLILFGSLRREDAQWAKNIFHR